MHANPPMGPHRVRRIQQLGQAPQIGLQHRERGEEQSQATVLCDLYRRIEKRLTTQGREGRAVPGNGSLRPV